MALTDGFPVFSDEVKKARLERYLQPLVPTFDGAHLVWLWFRYREQHVFWPWNEQRAAYRADTDVPDANFLHRGVIELLEAGDNYRVGYSTAYRHRGLDILRDLRVPVCFGGRPGDSQFGTLEQFPPGTWTQEMPRDALSAARAELEVLAKHPARGVPPKPPTCAPLPGRSTTDYTDVGNGQIFLRSRGNLLAAPPLVIVHHAPGSSALYDPLVCAIGEQQPVLAFDLPGHGESDALPDTPQTVEGWASALLRLLDTLGIGAVHLYGHSSGAAVAVEAALRAKERVRSLTLDAPICPGLAEQAELAARWLEGVEPVEPAWNGEHLLRVWHMRRDMELWWPWYERQHSNARSVEPLIDPARLTIEIREMMKQPARFAPTWRAAISYPLLERLARLQRPTCLMAAPQDVFARFLPQARGACPDARLLEVENTAGSRAQAILNFLASVS